MPAFSVVHLKGSENPILPPQRRLEPLKDGVVCVPRVDIGKLGLVTFQIISLCVSMVFSRRSICSHNVKMTSHNSGTVSAVSHTAEDDTSLPGDAFVVAMEVDVGNLPPC